MESDRMKLEEWSCRANPHARRGSRWQEDGDGSMEDHIKYRIGVS